MNERDQVKQILLETLDRIDDLETAPNALGKKKATFELDPELHKKLKLHATINNKNMVDIVEEALRKYLNLV